MEKKVIRDFFKKNTKTDIKEVIQDLGIKIAYIDYKEANGLYTKHKGKDYIFINKNISEKLQNFTLGHELCHFLLGETSLSVHFGHSKCPMEKRADNFSIDFFAPTKKLLELYQEYENIPTISDILGIPVEMIQYKLDKLICRI